MKLVVCLDPKNITGQHSYLVTTKTLEVTASKEEKLENLCDLEITEEVIRDFFRNIGYFYNKSDVLEYSYENYDEIEIKCCDKSYCIDDIINFIQENNFKKFKNVSFILDEDIFIEIDKLLDQELPENTTFKLLDNSQEISYEELLRIINYVNTNISGIEDFTILERVMYIYDLIKNTNSNNETSDINVNLCFEFLECINKLLDVEIKPETFARCLVNVRQKQEQDNPERFHVDVDEITSIIHNRYKPESSKEELYLQLTEQEYFTEEDARKIVKNILGKTNQPRVKKQKS